MSLSRKRRRVVNPGNKTAFTGEEQVAVFTAMAKLFRRSVHHLVHPQQPRGSMVALWRSFFDEKIWDHLNTAQNMMVLPSNSWQYFNFEDAYEDMEFNLEVSSRRFLPNREQATIIAIPPDIRAFVVAVDNCRDQWIEVYDTFLALNKTTTRKTAAFHWPAVTALLKLGCRSADDLLDITRPGNIPGELAVRCRDTSAFVMQHTLLPPIDTAEGSSYEGDQEVGLAARLSFTVRHDIFGDTLWPVAD